jgi:excisionase family DNA binding protein
MLPLGSLRRRASDERLTYDVPEAGRLLGLSRNSAYAAAKAGLIPVLNIGGRMLVPKAALHQMLAAAGAEWQRAREAAAKSGADSNTLKGRKGLQRGVRSRPEGGAET